MTDADPHPGLLAPIFVHCDTRLETLFEKRSVPLVSEQQTRRGVTGNVNVLPARPQEIGRDRREPESRLGR